MITHAGTLLPYTEFYRRVSSHMSLKEFRVALKTSGCCYVVREKGAGVGDHGRRFRFAI